MRREARGWCLISILLTLLLGFGALSLMGGCAPQATEIERVLMYTADKVMVPAVTKAIDETAVRTASIEGGIQGVEPGYSVEFEGFWCIGPKGKVEVRAVGVAAQAIGHVQTDAGQAASVEPPAIREDTTGPPVSESTATPSG